MNNTNLPSAMSLQHHHQDSAVPQNPPSEHDDLHRNSGSPSETTPLLGSLLSRIESHGLQGRNMVLSTFWNEVKTLTRYALPVFGTHVFEHSITISSVVSIGHISTIALAAASIGFMTANVSGLSVIQGMAGALDTVLPSAWTSGKPRLVGLWAQRMAVLQFIMLMPIYAIWLNGETILLALGQEPEVAKYAGIYLKWASLGLPAYALNYISRRYFQAQGLFDVPARIIVFVSPINILLTYLLVWGPNSTRLGFIGAPIATSVSYNLISIAYIIYGLFFVEPTAWHPISSQCLTSLGPLVRLSLGSVGQMVSKWWAWELVGLAASLIDPATLAAQSVLFSTISCTFQGPYALGVATSVRIGNLLGEREANRAGIVANAGLLLSFSLGLFFSGVLLAFRSTWGCMFNNDPVVVALVAAVLPMLALVQSLDDCSTVIYGILRSRGKQAWGAMINVSAYYCLGLPIGAWLTFKHHMGLFGLWWGLTAATALVVVLGSYLCLSTDWHAEVEKVTVRLAVDNVGQQGQRDEECVNEHGDSNRS